MAVLEVLSSAFPKLFIYTFFYICFYDSKIFPLTQLMEVREECLGRGKTMAVGEVLNVLPLF